jgi:Zn-dependent peptidase ImmA (M78 family)
MTREEIRKNLGGRLIGKEKMKGFVVEAVQKLPEKIQKQVVTSIWFVSSFEDAWGFVLKGDELKGKKLIFFSEELFNEPREQITYTIMHEIGHCILNHRNSILEEQTERETKKQEKEADTFAKEYL